MFKKSCPFFWSEYDKKNWTRLLGHRVRWMCFVYIGWIIDSSFLQLSVIVFLLLHRVARWRFLRPFLQKWFFFKIFRTSDFLGGFSKLFLFNQDFSAKKIVLGQWYFLSFQLATLVPHTSQVGEQVAFPYSGADIRGVSGLRGSPVMVFLGLQTILRDLCTRIQKSLWKKNTLLASVSLSELPSNISTMARTMYLKVKKRKTWSASNIRETIRIRPRPNIIPPLFNFFLWYTI